MPPCSRKRKRAIRSKPPPTAGAGIEPHEAPTSVQMSYDNGLDQRIEYRRERIIETIEEGPPPTLAVSVKSWWPEAPGASANYTYIDTLARPHLLVINERVTSYRLLQ